MRVQMPCSVNVAAVNGGFVSIEQAAHSRLLFAVRCACLRAVYTGSCDPVRGLGRPCGGWGCSSALLALSVPSGRMRRNTLLFSGRQASPPLPLLFPFPPLPLPFPALSPKHALFFLGCTRLCGGGGWLGLGLAPCAGSSRRLQPTAHSCVTSRSASPYFWEIDAREAKALRTPHTTRGCGLWAEDGGWSLLECSTHRAQVWWGYGGVPRGVVWGGVVWVAFPIL
eukprot:scaffold1188_cov124-Isochrysis_galbana.AAC.5